MREWYRLRELAQQARAALNRTVAGIHVGYLELIANPQTGVVPSLDVVARDTSFPLDSTAVTQAFQFDPFSTRAVPAVTSVPRVTRTQFNPQQRCVPIVECTERCVGSIGMIASPEALEAFQSGLRKPASVVSSGFQPMRRGTVQVLPNPELSGVVRALGLEVRTGTRRNMNIALRLPVSLAPVPWGSLDKVTLLRFWKVLKEKVAERAQGRDKTELEMSALFLDVDLSGVRRTRFDPGRRKLLLYPASERGRGRSNLRHCDIIIGLIKPTGEIVQVVVPQS